MSEFATSSGGARSLSGRNVTAVLGPTNTGKTHLAIERMLGHQSGLIGLPLRLLAREVYDKIVARIGLRDVALITGEEKIKPDNPRFYVCTVEAMPRDVEVDFLAVDEIQLAADLERGHVFTERLFSARGISETLLLGASTMQETIRDLLPGANFISRPRLSKLTYSGQKKITRLPRRSAIVAFSANDVYQIAELIRRQRGGAAVVLGALSPRTRNAQVALYQSGDVEFLVATDAVGMGLNLDVDHVAFAGTRKFDGRTHRQLTPGELGQIAGRAGRYMNDGTFGVTGDVEPFPQDVIDKLENHSFDSIKVLQWRNSKLSFDTADALLESLRTHPTSPRLARARSADDVVALETVMRDEDVRAVAKAPAAVRRLWDVCQIPDYRKISSSNHAEMIATLYKFIMSDAGVIPEDWFANQVAFSDRTDGDIDTLSTRIAHIRTWTFVSQKQEWLANPDHWQARTREIEDALSDALHERLTQRFVDKRTSVLMKTLRDSDTLFADIEQDGKIMVETHYVGRLDGFRFTPDPAATGVEGKAARNAAVKILATELASRAEKLCQSADTNLALDRKGRVLWSGHEIAQLEPSEDPLKPTLALLSDEHLQSNDRLRVLQRLNEWLTRYIEIRLKPLLDLSTAEDVTGLARGIAFRLKENFGVLRRDTVSEEIRALDQDSRSQLRKYGVRFGAHNVYFPLLLKPAPSELLLILWALKAGKEHGINLNEMPEGPRQGLTSVPVNTALPEAYYRVLGFQVCGSRAVRIDMLERLADLIRPLVSWKPTDANPEPPPSVAPRGGFRVQPEMMSIMGCSAEELGGILLALGFQKERLQKAPSQVLSRQDAPQKSEQIVSDGNATSEQSASAEPTVESSADTVANQNTDVVDNAGVTPQELQDEAALIASEGASVSSDTSSLQATPTSGDIEAVAVAAPEPEFEEIWRVKRARPERRNTEHQARRFSRGPSPQRDTRNQAGEPGATAPQQRAEGTAENRRSHQRDDRSSHNSGGKRHGHTGQNGKPPVNAGSQPTGENNSGAQLGKERHQDNRKPFKSRPPEKRQGPRVITAEPRNAQGASNADSPFAALLQLKERMEQQTQEPR